MSNVFEPVKVFEDENAIERQTNLFEDRLNYYQLINNLYNQLGFGVLKTDELESLVNTPKSFFYKKIVIKTDLGDHFQHLDPEKGFEMLQKPDGVESLIQKIEDFKLNHKPERFFHRQFENFVINEKGIVELSQKTKDYINNSCSVFVKSEEEHELFQQLKKLETCLNDLQKIRKRYHLNDELFTALFDYNATSGDVSLKSSFLSTYYR